MSEAKFTKGPWHVYDDGHDPGETRPGVDARGQTIVLFGMTVDDDDGGIRGATVEEAHANARLIAAAPELYEALRDLLAADVYADGEGLVSIENADTEDGSRAVIKARAALSKALGDSK